MEKIILKETVTTTKPEGQKPLKKKYHKSKKLRNDVQREINDITGRNINEVLNSEKPFVGYKSFTIKKNAGSYVVGKSFHIYFDKKPKSVHRFFTKLLLGWKWNDQK